MGEDERAAKSGKGQPSEGMDIALKILCLEDERNDVELVRETLLSHGIDAQIVVVSTREGFLDSLEKERFDVVLADYTLPSFDGLSALAIVRERFSLLPFIFVTGTMGEERAVETLKQGATDYVLKSNLARLVPSIIRALRESEDLRKRQEAEGLLKTSEERLYNSFLIQSAISTILKESLERVPIEAVLQKALSSISLLTWLPQKSFSCIHLLEGEPGVLELKAEDNLPESLRKSCARVPLGECLCGKAAQGGEILFANHRDECHKIHDAGVGPHSHYLVPIQSGGETLGVMNVGLEEGHVRDEKEEALLHSVARTLAEVIVRRKAEEKIDYLAYYDALTGLPNRTLFLDRVRQGIVRAKPFSRIVGVLIIDIDRFESINDTYGTEVGDRVLRIFGEKLSTAVRGGDTVARLGNDEFGIALLDVAHIDHITPVMEKIRRHMSGPLRSNGTEVELTFSAGISVCPRDHEDAHDLVKSAGLALTMAKKEGRKAFRYYTEELNEKASEFVLMERNLLNALKKEEFVLHYQPYWDVVTKKMVGMEALVRWKSRDNGLVPPGKFIPVLEDTGLIIEAGEWILREAVRQVKAWQNAGYPVVPVAVNISLIQFRQQDFTEMVKRTMSEFGFYPSLLTIEITESAFLRDMEFTRSVLDILKGMGISISIDDFGTGYSSLACLKRFPVDNLKIDMSFIREMVTDPDSASIVIAIINMARSLQLRTIAEGIENEEQWKILRLFRCDMGQGFYLSRPLPAKEIEELLVGGADEQ